MKKTSNMPKRLGVACAIGLLATSALAADENPTGPGEPVPNVIGNSVVKIFATLRNPDLAKPWSKQAPADISGSGVVIDGHRILTNAHLVMYDSQVQIQANQAGDKLSATVVAVAPGIDLAVLKLDDDSFFDTHMPLARADGLLQIKDAILAYGYPTGGSSLSITKGIVSRVEFVTYNFPVSGLRIQVDAAINPGNSGGAAIADDKMIGLVFSRAGGDTQNIGYIIPNEEISLFLNDIADGHYDGKPAMYDELQTLENTSLRNFLHVDKSVTGMVVHRPRSTENSYPLKEWDVITRIGEWPIDDQGRVKVNHDLSVAFQYRVQQIARNGSVPLTIVRGGSSRKVQLPVDSVSPRLIPSLNGEYPSYFIYGPLVFSRASTQLLLAYAENAKLLLGLSFIGSPLISGLGAAPDPQHDDLVVVASPFFPSSLAKGYDNPTGRVVESVNGTRVRSIKHLVVLLRDLKDQFAVIAFANPNGASMVFPRSDMLAATEGILADNGVRARGSPDLMAVWQEKAKP